MPKISMIMPVYNSKEYINEAIDSILQQDLEDLELLLMDDGSSDGSEKICDSYSKSDPRVKVFHLENGGASRARNFGIDEASGEYIGFCDNDDMYLPGAFSDVYDMASKNDCDCVSYGRRLVRYGGDGSVIASSEMAPKSTHVLSGNDIADDYESWCQSSAGVWSKLYKTSFLKQHNIYFNEDLRNGAEDTLFNIEVISKAKRIGYIAKTYYVWKQRLSHSTSMKLSKNKIEGLRLVIHDEHELMVQKQIDVRDPELFARRMLNVFYGTITEMIDIPSQREYSNAKDFYEDLFGIYKDYDHAIDRKKLPLMSRIGYGLLMRRHWRMLHFCTKSAISAKRKFNLNISA